MLDILIAAAGILGIILIWIILFDSNRFVVRQYRFTDARIRRPFTAVILADLHNKRYGKGNRLLLDEIERQRPDMILIAGDMITAKRKKGMDAALEALRGLADKYPVYYANGNHEFKLELFPEKFGDLSEVYESALRDMGIRRLLNEHVVLEELGVAVYGAHIAREYYKKVHMTPMGSDYMRELLGEPAGEHYNILLAHHPDYFPRYAAWGADLVVSGHIHGGLVRIPGWRGIISPMVRLFPRYDGGLFREGGSSMLLSRGLGAHSIPIRLFNPGEILTAHFAPEKE